MHSLRPLLIASLGLAAIALLSAADQGGSAERPPVPIDQGLADRGKPIYERFCVSCHGPQGDGHGYSAQWLDPMPRDFTSGIFKCRSTPSGTLPTDDGPDAHRAGRHLPHVHAALGGARRPSISAR